MLRRTPGAGHGYPSARGIIVDANASLVQSLGELHISHLVSAISTSCLHPFAHLALFFLPFRPRHVS